MQQTQITMEHEVAVFIFNEMGFFRDRFSIVAHNAQNGALVGIELMPKCAWMSLPLLREFEPLAVVDGMNFAPELSQVDLKKSFQILAKRGQEILPIHRVNRC